MAAVFNWRGTTPVASDLLEQMGKRRCENRRAKSQKKHAGIRSRPVAVDRSQSVQNTKHIQFGDVAQIVGRCLFQPGYATVGICRDGCVVVIKYLRRQPVDLVAGMFRLPFSLVTSCTFVQASLWLFRVSTFRSHLELVRVIVVRTRQAIGQFRPNFHAVGTRESPANHLCTDK